MRRKGTVEQLAEQRTRGLALLEKVRRRRKSLRYSHHTSYIQPVEARSEKAETKVGENKKTRPQAGLIGRILPF
jgi:hypothetical protein